MENMDDAVQYGNAVLVGTKVRLRELHESDLTTLAHWWNRPGPATLQAETVKPRPASAVQEIELRTWSFNTWAVATYRRVGFAEEGRRRQVVFHQGRFHDQILMGILADEWRTETS